MRYYAKILLFGEYAIVRGSQALALPLPQFFCQWVEGERSTEPIGDTDPTKADRAANSRRALKQFLSYLKKTTSPDKLPALLDLQRFESDLAEGLFLSSNIPIGYGVGSSGALCAAVYDRYAREKIERTASDRYVDLRRLLARMESFFHGSSSGVDPLICYLNEAVLIKTKETIELIPFLAQAPASKLQFFLLDTRQSRQTGPLVELFLKKCSEEEYALKIEREFVRPTEIAIKAYLQSDWKNCMTQINAISQAQWKYFREMVPVDFHSIWTTGLNSNYFKIKLCGAGGGGFLLGVTNDKARVETNFGEKYNFVFLS